MRVLVFVRASVWVSVRVFVLTQSGAPTPFEPNLAAGNPPHSAKRINGRVVYFL